MVIINESIKEGGAIVLETLIVPEKYGEALIPDTTYANMRNVRVIHTELGLKKIINSSGLKIIESSEKITTSTKEQRSTKWMPFRSLADALDKKNRMTKEGLPRPQRIFVLLSR